MVAETDCNSDEVCDGFRCVTNNCIGSDCEEWEVCDDSDGSCNLLKNRCYQENDCTPYSNKKCLQASHSCVECLIPSDCGTGKLCTNNMCENDPCYNNSCTAYQQCNSVTGACEYISGRCDSVSHCSGETTRKTCDTESNYCVECLNASDCNVSANEVCDDYNQCQTNQCVGSNCDEWELCDSNDGSCDPKPGRCNLKADCSGSLSACDTDSHTCVECTVKADCTGAGEYCTESNECIVDYCHENSCNGWETCDDSDGSCDLNANRCNSTSDCGSEVCNTTTNYCVECLTKNDCTGDKICNDTNYCVDESSGSVSDLMISEYVEGSANSKCLELYNGIGASINLSNYNLRRTQEGSDFRTSFLLPDYELANNKTYVVCYHNSEADFLDKADLLTDNSNYDALSFSGDDDVALFKGDALIDWVGVGATQGDWGKSVTLIRKSTVTTPSTTYDASEWEEHPENYIDNLGSHTVQ